MINVGDFCKQRAGNRPDGFQIGRYQGLDEIRKAVRMKTRAPPPEARPANAGRQSAAAPLAEASEAKGAAKKPADLYATGGLPHAEGWGFPSAAPVFAFPLQTGKMSA